MRQNKVLVIDDDKELCSLLQRALVQENYEVELCYDGGTGLELFWREEYQLVVLDIMLPVINGFSVLEKIREKANVPVLMLTAKDSESDKVSGLRLGADDYLTKPFLMNEFTARAHSLIRRYTVFNSTDSGEEILKFRGLEIYLQRRNVYVDGTEIDLTAKEFDLLYFLASNQGKVFTKGQIYNHVWQEEYSFDDSNIMSFISKLRKKIRSESVQSEYIQTIHGIGYRFRMEV